MRKVKNFIWDFNGTLLDDVEICVAAMNRMLKKRGKKAIDASFYKKSFGFPVYKYYEKAGFNFKKLDGKVVVDEGHDHQHFDCFATLSKEFIEFYESNKRSCSIYPQTIETLHFFRSRGVAQALLSAYKHDTLLEMLEELSLRVSSYFPLELILKKINNPKKPFFEDVQGNQVRQKNKFRLIFLFLNIFPQKKKKDIYAHGKVGLGISLLERVKFDKDSTVIIGDTAHDHQVGKELGVCFIYFLFLFFSSSFLQAPHCTSLSRTQ